LGLKSVRTEIREKMIRQKGRHSVFLGTLLSKKKTGGGNSIGRSKRRKNFH